MCFIIITAKYFYREFCKALGNELLIIPSKSSFSNYPTPHFFMQNSTLLQQPKTAPKERKYHIFVALERGLNVSRLANIQPTVIESQIYGIFSLWERLPCLRQPKFCIKKANQKGLEPPTHGSGNRCSIQLSYWSTGSL